MKTTLRFLTESAGTPFRSAAAARRTIPAPASTRYGTPLAMIATAGPRRSGSALGVPVPRSTTFVARVSTRPAGRTRSSGRPGSCAPAEAVIRTVNRNAFIVPSSRLLLQELGDRGSQVRGGPAQRIDFGTQPDGSGKILPLDSIELLLGQGEGGGTASRQLRQQRLRVSCEGLGGQGAGYQAEALGLFRAQRPPGRHQVEGRFLSQRAPQDAHYDGRHEATLDFRVAEQGVDVRHDEIAAGGEPHPAGEATAVHHRDYRLGDLPHFLED